MYTSLFARIVYRYIYICVIYTYILCYRYKKERGCAGEKHGWVPRRPMLHRLAGKIELQTEDVSCSKCSLAVLRNWTIHILLVASKHAFHSREMRMHSSFIHRAMLHNDALYANAPKRKSEKREKVLSGNNFVNYILVIYYIIYILYTIRAALSEE